MFFNIRKSNYDEVTEADKLTDKDGILPETTGQDEKFR